MKILYVQSKSNGAANDATGKPHGLRMNVVITFTADDSERDRRIKYLRCNDAPSPFAAAIFIVYQYDLIEVARL